MTNLIQLLILSINITTNTQPGDGLFRQFKDHLVGIRSVDFAVQNASYGYLDGTNRVELFNSQKLLWAKTNWNDMPLVMGVQSPAVNPPPPPIPGIPFIPTPASDPVKQADPARTNSPPSTTPRPVDPESE